MKNNKLIFCLSSLAAFGSVVAIAANSSNLLGKMNRTNAAVYEIKEMFVDEVTDSFSSGVKRATNANGGYLDLNYSSAKFDGNNIIMSANSTVIVEIAGGTGVSADIVSGSLKAQAAIDLEYKSDEETMVSNTKVNYEHNVRYIILTAGDEGATVNSLTYNYACSSFYEDHIIDGKMDFYDRGLWSNEVQANSYRLSNNANNYTDFYVTRDDNGVYVFADQYVDTIKNVGSGWWEQDNFELRILDLYSGARDDKQIYGSASGANTFTTFAKTGYSNENGLHHISYEGFVSYDSGLIGKVKTVSKDTLLVFQAGQNLNLGFVASSNWYNTPAASDTLVLTSEGFKKLGDFGNERLASPVSYTGKGWQSNVAKIDVDGSQDFVVRFEANYSCSDTNWGHTFVSEVYSEGWSNGGYTARGDWWGWGTWFNSDEAYHGWNSSELGDDPKYGDIKQNMKVEGVVRFSTLDSLIRINIHYYPLSEPNVGRIVEAFWISNVVSYRGRMSISLGTSDDPNSPDATVTINSIKVIEGVAL